MIPYVRPLGLPISITPLSRGIFNELENLEAGDNVILSINGGVSAWPEILPAMIACGRMVVNKDANLIVLGFGHTDIDITWNEIKAGIPNFEDEMTYGEDYAYFGYFPSQETTIKLLAEDMRQVFSNDVYGNSIEGLPLMQQVNSYEDVKLVLTSDTGEVGMQWMRQWGSAHDIAVAEIGIAMNASSMIPFYKTGDVVGIAVGARGGAELEKLVGYAGGATITMDSINVSHMLLIIAIALANVGYVENLFGGKK
jgi:hypothetical protein